MNDSDLIAAAKERCLKRRLYDEANQCIAAEEYLKAHKILHPEYRKLLQKYLYMQPAGKLGWVLMGQGAEPSKEYNEHQDSLEDKPKHILKKNKI